MPKVSVVIPTYNRHQFLQGAIVSVLNQTFEDFEIIVVDDASKDDTPTVVSSLSDKRVKYVRHPANRGGSAARNTGILRSDAKYVALLDDDDEWHPDKLKMQVDLIDKADLIVGVVYTGYDIIDRTTGAALGRIVPSKKGDLSKALLSQNYLGGSSSVLLRRECFEQVGLFDESLPSFQDYDMWIRISTAFHFEYIQDSLLRYYVHDNKIWATPEAIKNGIDKLLKKYGVSRSLRKYCSYIYLDVGVLYCYAGQIGDGRAAFSRAIKLYPLEIRHYFYFCLSLMGLSLFKKAKENKEKIVEKLSLQLR
jgi:glycosyltransferase involved in cell wall biosynthesis